MSKSNYEKYKELKSQFDFEYRGFNMGQVMGTELALVSYDYSNITNLTIIKNFIKYWDIATFINDNHAENFITYTIDRNDYRILCEQYIEKLKLEDYIFKILPENIEKLKLNPIIIVKTLLLIFKIKNMRLKNKVYIVSSMVAHMNTIDSLLENEIKLPKNYYAFNSSYKLETLITLYLKLKKIPTYSFQHGIYFKFNKPIPIDVINWENFVADKMLCWGQYSIDEMKKFDIDENRLIKFENPKYSSIITYKKDKDIFDNALVILSREYFEEGNIKLLELLSCLSDINFEIKLHPSLDFDKYKKITDRVSHLNLVPEKTLLTSLFDKSYNFIITYNTTSHYESIISGFLTFGYAYNSDGGKLFESFEDAIQLENLIQVYQQKAEYKMKNDFQRFVGYTMGINDDQ